MKIYTKTGDQGETGLFGGGRVKKTDPRVVSYGEVDELNSTIGWVRVELQHKVLDQQLEHIQNELFDLGAELSTLPEKLRSPSVHSPPGCTFPSRLSPLARTIHSLV